MNYWMIMKDELENTSKKKRHELSYCIILAFFYRVWRK